MCIRDRFNTSSFPKQSSTLYILGELKVPVKTALKGKPKSLNFIPLDEEKSFNICSILLTSQLSRFSILFLISDKLFFASIVKTSIAFVFNFIGLSWEINSRASIISSIVFVLIFISGKIFKIGVKYFLNFLFFNFIILNNSSSLLFLI